MNIRELKEIIKDLPDEMLIGQSGYFGEYLECYSVSVSEVWLSTFDLQASKIDILNFSMETMGEEPD